MARSLFSKTLDALRNNSDHHQRNPLEGCVSIVDCRIACYGVLFWFARLLPIASHVCYFDAIEQLVVDISFAAA